MKTVYLMLLRICLINVIVRVKHNDVGQMLLSQKCRYAKGIHLHKDFLVLLPNLQNNTSDFEHPFFKKKKQTNKQKTGPRQLAAERVQKESILAFI